MIESGFLAIYEKLNKSGIEKDDKEKIKTHRINYAFSCTCFCMVCTE